MRRVQADGNLNGEYTPGNPVTGVPRTRLESGDLNVLFRELIAVVQGAGLTLNPNDDTQLLQAVNTIALGQSKYRNVLINGEFLVHQRQQVSAIANAGANVYAADRWFGNNNNGASGSLEMSFSNSHSPNPTAGWPPTRSRALLALGCSGTSLANPMLLAQRIEDVRTLAGQTVTLSFWAKCQALALTITPKLRQYFGPSPAPAAVTTALPACVLSSTWQRFVRTVQLPPALAVASTGWPLGGAGYNEVRHWLELQLEISAPSGTFGALQLINLTDVQLEAGSSPSAFERVPWVDELLRCQRYYETSLEPTAGLAYFLASVPMYGGAVRSNQAGTVAQGIDTRFAVPKARIPTITWYSPETGASGNIRWNGADRAVTSTEHTSIVNTGAPVIGSSQAASSIHAHYIAEAELQ